MTTPTPESLGKARAIIADWCSGDPEAAFCATIPNSLAYPIATALDEARAEERERCAKIADACTVARPGWGTRTAIAAAIRRQGE